MRHGGRAPTLSGMSGPSSRRAPALPPKAAAEFIRAKLPLTEVP
ncbi:MAG: hypothetical protein AVDCRST_MAG15-2561 [uncultured Rubellimicrobium sp.]|uniref:Uncharacterized protein n=1 Tax=uncultured Rubellimicrobium sp. TaxID=543078 RepID=A0A6J4PV17_9RHOB|nr:MAG: hypothetical protein AVDCRST_MAG15-2561 [uncultured Rubellimicrobium sp.]